MKYFWCIGPTVVAQFNTADEATSKLEEAPDRITLNHGDALLHLEKSEITVMGEDEYEALN